MATSTLSLIVFLCLLAATASARPCKTLFYFSAATTHYPYNSIPENPNTNSLVDVQRPRYFTLIFTSSARPLADRRPSIHFDVDADADADADNSQASSVMMPSDLPIKFYSSVSRSIRERTKDIMSVVGALLFGVGCGALTAALTYFIWALFFPTHFNFADGSSSSDDDDDDDDVVTAKRKLGYLAIPTKVVEDDLKKPAPPAKEVV